MIEIQGKLFCYKNAYFYMHTFIVFNSPSLRKIPTVMGKIIRKPGFFNLKGANYQREENYKSSKFTPAVLHLKMIL